MVEYTVKVKECGTTVIIAKNGKEVCSTVWVDGEEVTVKYCRDAGSDIHRKAMRLAASISGGKQ